MTFVFHNHCYLTILIGLHNSNSEFDLGSFPWLKFIYSSNIDQLSLAHYSLGVSMTTVEITRFGQDDKRISDYLVEVGIRKAKHSKYINQSSPA